MGAFEAEEKEIEASQLMISPFNGAVITYAERQVYVRDNHVI